MTKFIRQLLIRAILPFLAILISGGSAAAQLDILQTPLFLTSSVPPNVIMTLDDSGSMCWGYTPGASGYSSSRGPFTTPATSSGYGNGLYYNPRTVYTVPQRVDQPTKYTTSFAGAYMDGFDQSQCTVDLSSHFSPPTGSFCNNGPQTSYKYTCSAIFGQNTKACRAVFSATGTTTNQSCNNTTFTRNSYSSTCDITYQQNTVRRRTYFYITAQNCADTSIYPFEGLSPNSNVTVGNSQYTVISDRRNGPANGTTIIRVSQTVTPSTIPVTQTVSWDQGPDTIHCSDWRNSIFNGVTAGTAVNVSGNNSNNGAFTVANSNVNNNTTIAVTSHVVPQSGVRATFSWTSGSPNSIAVSNCGSNPFLGLTSGNTVTVTGTQYNNATFTLASNPSSNNTVLALTGGITDETASNAIFTWAASPANMVTVTQCVDSSGDSNNTPFSPLSSGDTVKIENSTSNDGTYTLSQNPTNNDTTLTMSSTNFTPGTDTHVEFSWNNSSSTCNTGGTAAYYDLYYADLASVSGVTGASKPSGCTTDSRSNSSCYIRVTVGSANDQAYSGWGSAALSEQNFANWYSFYRTRALSAMSGATNAVSSFDDDEVRLAWQTINKCTSFTSNCLGFDNSMRPLTASHRTAFYNWLEHFVPGGYTPLRNAMKRAGVYYQQSGLNGPYVKDPGHDDSAYSFDGTTTELSCRKDFHIMFTDGYWNGSTPSSPPSGNVDGLSATMPDNVAFTAPKSPYSSSNTMDLSDISFYYWSHDLRSDLTNNVPSYFYEQSSTNAADNYWNPKNDPATWQHMTNFTIGLGLSADLGADWAGTSYTGAYDDFVYNNRAWPSDGSNSAGNVYDLWHAALNSRGQFFNADTAESVSTAFADIITAIRSGNSSSAAVAANSTSIQPEGGTLIYQASFDPSDWSGHLKAINVLSNGDIGSVEWDAATEIPAAGDRNIFTISAATNAGVVFDTSDCSNLSTTAQGAFVDQQAALNNCDANLINYLRGDASKEIRNSTTTPPSGYRNRSTTVLGDIINSDPAFAYNENYGYATATNLSSAEKNAYTTFLADKTATGKHRVVYVGSNDGMLHAFNAEYSTADGGGTEDFAYIPAGVYGNLAALANTNYSHTYLTDGAPSVGDAYVGGSWKTYLVSGLNGGGKSVYALDVTNPESFSATDVKWEFTESDLGYTYSKPQISRLTDGTWVAIFGNGYNSTNGHAVLYVVNLADGSLVKKMDTYSLDTNTAADNGMSTPALYVNGGVVETAYAGDLHGNLWKFDISDADPNNWSVTRLFAATNSSGQAQPITAPPTVGPNSNGGNMVYFGTGRYLTSTDPADMTVQSFYGIWDNPSLTPSGSTPSVSRSSLQQQYITVDASVAGTQEYGFYNRETTSNPVNYATQNGWFMDLLPYTVSGTSYTAGTPQGERVRSIPLLKYNRVIFVTLIPSLDPCKPGGESWLMELNAQDGNATAVSSFDFNNDNKFNNDDLLQSGHVSSGIMLTSVGIATSPTWLEKNATSAIKVITGSKGTTISIGNKGGSGVSGQQIYWQQIL